MKFNINPFYTFLYKTVAKFIGVVLLFLLGAYTYTAGFFGCIIVSLFVYTTAVIATHRFVKDTLDYFYNNKPKSNKNEETI